MTHRLVPEIIVTHDRGSVSMPLILSWLMAARKHSAGDRPVPSQMEASAQRPRSRWYRVSCSL